MLRIWLCGLAVVAGAGLPGCRGVLERREKIDRVGGPLSRAFAREKSSEDETRSVRAGADELAAADRLFEQKKYSDAAAAYKKIAKKFKDLPAEERALFYYAECLFEQKHYPDAQDAYDSLLKKYPSTQYLEESTRRLFAIASYWLESPKLATEVELAKYTRLGPDGALKGKDIPKTPGFTIVPNVTDDSRPLWDAPGRAVQALTSVWLNDPTGPLADDALMLAATHSIRNGDYMEADRYLNLLRDEYPNSEHTTTAYVLSPHVKLMAYQGPMYDGKQLEDARRVARSALQLYPDIPQRTKLLQELGKINRQSAQRDWEQAQFYLRKGYPKAAAVHCELIISEHPESPLADSARELLAKVGPENAAGVIEFAQADNPYLQNRSSSLREKLDRKKEPTWLARVWPWGGQRNPTGNDAEEIPDFGPRPPPGSLPESSPVQMAGGEEPFDEGESSPAPKRRPRMKPVPLDLEDEPSEDERSGDEDPAGSQPNETEDDRPEQNSEDAEPATENPELAPEPPWAPAIPQEERQAPPPSQRSKTGRSKLGKGPR